MTAHTNVPDGRGDELSSVAAFQRQLVENLVHVRGVGPDFATPEDWYHALAHTVRQHLMHRWLGSLEAQLASGAKFVCYLSAEYLLGRQLDNNLLSAGVGDTVRDGLAGMGLDLDVLREVEVEPGLGNGGLGRLAACFLDSLAHLEIAATGFGIRYEYGIFRQTFREGRQVEVADQWLRHGNPWEFPHPEMAVRVDLGGQVEPWTDEQGRERRRWVPERTVLAVPYNYMVPGYRSHTVNTLRLWSARSADEFDLQIFNSGDYTKAVQDKVSSENISKVLYPDDTTPQGKLLRLEQQFFFVSASLQDILRLLGPETDLRELPDRVALQLNDTHPAVAVAELMRLLVDERGIGWDEAWVITTGTCAYTCHTLLPEALEVWPADLFGQLLPRHLEIIREIDARFLAQVEARWPGDGERRARMAIIGDGGQQSVRMAHLATVGGHCVNGVAELHSQLLRETVLKDFAELWPERFTNVTNGVTPRRFVRLANPRLSELITEALGTEAWVGDLGLLAGLEPFADDAAFRQRWQAVKRANKQALNAVLLAAGEPGFDDASMLDVMVKRLHEYKRQLLKVLHVVVLHQRLRDDPSRDVVPRTVLFGAKAAPGYVIAKEMIRLVNAVAATVDADPAVAGRLRVLFPANYNVTLAERIIPAADLSEQISTAGKEASGTGNMKLALNGALTVGTLDGANVEIRELVGDDHFFLFGLHEDEVRATVAAGYRPRDRYEADEVLRRAIDAIEAGDYSDGERGAHAMVVDMLVDRDPYLVLADAPAYVAVQDDIDVAYCDVERWTRSSILNVARCGPFSSDRSIRDYLDRIWHAAPFDVARWQHERSRRLP